ncbi:hypothetical protein OTJ99_000448 [Caldicellulosiruptor naganoensis]|uniref:Uncharacterized protein n=1 Tax=Caldicellulosiruptor naganoensis TaxID=29324 RepID=A0ABY7BIS3_9FIRM|nr:hypothetical protein [Caldicellulosiruptor naganoensis]WAM31961.1 hypothetical protein OTJ99_000448 [Caldicellulosiruptor naganoensis]
MSERYPEKIFKIVAVESATPSISPIIDVFVFRTFFKKRGSALIVSSLEKSFKKLTKPNMNAFHGIPKTFFS